MNNPKVSVIVPVYNSERFVAQAIESVLAQTYKNFEIVVVNDGSTDQSYEKIKPYLSSIRYISQENRGAPAARNNGILKSTGEFIAFLDADDIWDVRKIEEQMEYINRHKETGMVHTNVSYIDIHGNHRKPHILNFPNSLSGNCFERLFNDGNGICTSTVLLNKECLYKTGLFGEGFFPAEDYELWMRISIYFPIGYIDKCLTRYRIHEENASRYSADNTIVELTVIRNILRNFPDVFKNIDTQIIKKRFYRLYCKIAELNKREDSTLQSLKYYLHAMMTRPILFYSELFWNSLSNSQRKTLSWYKHKIKQSMTNLLH